MVHDDSDEELGVRLDIALKAGLESTRVDIDELLSGSHRRAHRLRSQRIAGAALAAVLIIGLPAGFEIIHPTAGASGPPAMLSSAGSAGSGARPTRTQALRTVAELAQFAPSAMALPSGLTLTTTTAVGPAGGRSIVAGQECPSTGSGARPSRRQWIWETSGGASTDLRVTLTVADWPAAAASPAVSRLSGAAGGCRWLEPQTVQPFTLATAQQAWSSSSGQGDRFYGRTVIRVGDLTAGIEVRDPAGRVAALTLAQRLAATEAERLATTR